MAALKVTDAYAVSAKIIALKIETGNITKGSQIPYVQRPGDFIDDGGLVYRADGSNGILVEDGRLIRIFDTISGPDLDVDWAKNAANYRVNGIRPTQVFIKGKISDAAEVDQGQYRFAKENTVFLKLPTPMRVGQRYSLDFAGNELQDISYRYTPNIDRSEAVHVSQLGFHPEDPSKVAFLSTWMGERGGGLNYRGGQKFWLVNASGRRVYQGEIKLSRRANYIEDFRGLNYNGTNVYIADFSDFKQKGKFKVVVDKVGRSFEFEIGDTTWEDAFQVSMEGLYTQRSGIAIRPQYSEYTAPRSFHPDDGIKVLETTVKLFETGDEDFATLAANTTGRIVNNAWGGWKDAGDWDRRTPHLRISRDLLELSAMFPNYFPNVNLTIPESNNQLADTIDEALWGIDFFRRIQRADGGVRGGIESGGNPKGQEASWQESQAVYAYAPDAITSYAYAGAAARAAYILQDTAPAKAIGYRRSAIKAMHWARREDRVNPGNNPAREWEKSNERNLAALELYRLTGNRRWHNIFLQETVLRDPQTDAFRFGEYDQRDAAFLYTQLESSLANSALQSKAKAALVRRGNFALRAISQSAFKWYKDPGAGFGFGANSAFADRSDLVRAHYLTGNEKFLRGVVLSSQFMTGANPDNTSYVTGIGTRQPDSVLHKDSLVRGQSAPKGISIYGPFSFDIFGNSPPPDYVEYLRGKTATPIEAWPTTEAFFDSASLVPSAEFTVADTITPNAYAWGYVAANRAGGGAIARSSNSTLASESLWGAEAQGFTANGAIAPEFSLA